VVGTARTGCYVGEVQLLERFRVKWVPVHVKKTRKNNNLELWF
jgi:hypothetical protein